MSAPIGQCVVLIINHGDKKYGSIITRIILMDGYGNTTLKLQRMSIVRYTSVLGHIHGFKYPLTYYE